MLSLFNVYENPVKKIISIIFVIIIYYHVDLTYFLSVSLGQHDFDN